MVVAFALSGMRTFAGEDSKIVAGGVTYLVYRCQPEEVRLFWRDADEKPIGQFSRLQTILAERGRRLEFAMNGGIFEPGGIPTGLHIENGQELRPLNRSNGTGNFYLKPNGVFCVSGKSARILETEEFARAGLNPRFALQSGPLLLHHGGIHPAFIKDSPNRLHRNGVGIDAEGRVVFAITVFDERNRVNLYGFAEFFRSLGCRDALFLDGDISMAVVNPKGPLTPVNHFGAILAVTPLTDSR